MPRQGSALLFSSFDTDNRCTQLSEHRTTRVHGSPKITLQRFYHRHYVIPKSEYDGVYCEQANYCPHYMYNESRRKAVELAEKAAELVHMRKTKAAESKLKMAMETYPLAAFVLFSYGELLYDAGKLKKAQTYLKDALIEAPRWPDVHYLLGQINFEKARYAIASEHFNELVDANPEDESGWWLLASALSELQGRESDALQALEHHLAMSPEDSDARELQRQLRGRVPDEL